MEKRIITTSASPKVVLEINGNLTLKGWQNKRSRLSVRRSKICPWNRAGRDHYSLPGGLHRARAHPGYA
jgi:hypothetical protein